MLLLLYSILYTLVVLILLIPEYLKRAGHLRSRWLREKFGILPAELITSGQERIWVHAVSVGEVTASIPLLRALKNAYPHMTMILSTITDTGQQVAREKAPVGTIVVYLPLDMTVLLRICLKKVMPKAFVVIETELWPNLFRILGSLRIPLLLFNGRISEESFKGYRMISFFMKKFLSSVSVFGMQSQGDADRLREIGAEAEKIRTTGNFKFDMQMPGSVPSWAQALQGPVLVAGSTHQGEEEIILSAYRDNADRFPGLKLVLAPRHPERFTEAEELIKKSGLPYIRRSELLGQPAEAFDHGIILLDTIGELTAVYGVADIAIIGKSFRGTGGQNPLEPALWGKPILCGPHMENFPFMQEFYDSGGAHEVDATTLAKKIKELLMDPEKAEASGKAAKAVFQKYSGAVARSMELIRPYIAL